MILLIDNYDSFSYNLYQLIGSINPDIRVIRNDAMAVSAIRALAPEAIILYTCFGACRHYSFYVLQKKSKKGYRNNPARLCNTYVRNGNNVVIGKRFG